MFNIFRKPKKMTIIHERQQPQPTNPPEQISVDSDLESNLKYIQQALANPVDMVVRRIINHNEDTTAVVVYLQSLVDSVTLGTHVIDPIISTIEDSQEIGSTFNKVFASNTSEIEDLEQAVSAIAAGKVIVLSVHERKVLVISVPGFPRRSVTEPSIEKVIKGSKESFSDFLMDNLSMIRRWIKDSRLRAESLLIGERTKTELAILYLEDVAQQEIVQEVRKRLSKIKIDGILESGYIKELIADNKWTVFPLAQETERPDKVAAAVLEGRVAILVDKSPFAIIVPVTSTEFYQTPEDFNLNYWIASFIKGLRAIGTFTSLTLPGFYAAVMSINPDFFPSSLIIVLASGRASIPFPVVFELLLTLLIFEIFREAIIRVPGNINVIVGIAGGFLLGNAAIQVGIVSGSTVAVVIVTILATFSTASTEKEQAWRVVRYFLLFGGSIFGILGLTLAGLVVLTHLNSLKSFGVSYLAPWGPPLKSDLVDGIFRMPWWARHKRPVTYRPQDINRQAPSPEEE